MRHLRLIVPPHLDGERLDRGLAALSTLSRRRARALIREGRVVRNGKPLRVEGKPLGFADVLEVRLDSEEAATPRTEAAVPDAEIVYRDRWLIAVHKPSGVLSQPAASRRPDDLAMDQILTAKLAREDGRPPFLRLVHRIDRVTSGLLLFAAHPDALAPLDHAWREGAVDRRYLAVVTGTASFERQEVDAPIARVPGKVWRFQVSKAGKAARTQVVRLAKGDGFSVVQCRLRTGRTHQVRVHLAYLGLPVLGDTLYGGTRNRAPRPLLHAAELRLPHPAIEETLLLRANPPKEFFPYLEGCPSLVQ